MNGRTMPKPTVRTLSDGADERAWDAFVEAAPEATFFHRAGWRRVIEGTYGHRCHFLYVASSGGIRGVLPLVHIDSRLFGRSLVSTAFGVYGGPVSADPEARDLLDAAASDLAWSLRVGVLEYRLRHRQHSDWPCQDQLYATFRKAIDPDPDVNMKAIPRKQRAMVRKGIGFGLESRADDDVDGLFRIYSESVRNLGTPVFPRRYFRALRDVFADSMDVVTVTQAGRPVSGVLNFYFRDEVLPFYGGGSREARDLAANDFMYWEVMRRAGERGCRLFDFGRSKAGTGAFAFKKNWGFTPEPLYHEYRLVTATERPEVNPLNPKYQRMIALWRRLPLPVANVVGPWIARDLG
ncbi:MAG TPA: FemAB family XrtA/PEP-CTERM system-associated protein [Alphaproteobacteria bacterium]|nr:FemAB family XrtA/PEP-CTERM system-associated protein [Alphaproteobacteria bacterium]